MNTELLARTLVEEGYELPLDMVVAMNNQGVLVDEFVDKLEWGFNVEQIIDHIEMYGV